MKNNLADFTITEDDLFIRVSFNFRTSDRTQWIIPDDIKKHTEVYKEILNRLIFFRRTQTGEAFIIRKKYPTFMTEHTTYVNEIKEHKQRE